MDARTHRLGFARPAAPDPPTRQVLLVDAPPTRVRRPGDLVSLLLCLAGIAVVLVLAVYAHGTTQGVTEDVQSAVADVLRAVLLVPVTVLEGLLTFFVPVAVVIGRVARRSWRSAGEIVLSALAAAAVATAALWAMNTYAPVALTVGLTITADGYAVIGMNPYVAALAGLLTAAGERKRQRSVRWWWNLLWVVLGLSVIQGEQTLPGAVVTVLIGRAAGLGMRYASGVLHDRANGLTLVRGVRRGGLDPVRVVRLDPLPEGQRAQAWTVTTSAPLGYVEGLRERGSPGTDAEQDGDPGPAGSAEHPSHPENGELDTPADLLAAVDRDTSAAADSIVPDALTDPDRVLSEVATSTPLTVGRDGVHRVYAVWDAQGRRSDVIVLDGDQQVVGYLAGLWDALRMRGLDRRAAPTVHEASDRAALMMLAADAAGVRTPRLCAVAEAHDSVLMITEHVPRARRLDDLAPEEVHDAVLDQLWSQLRAAHRQGLAHRDLHAGSVLVDQDDCVWMLDWENGEIASSELARRVDMAQVLAMTAALVGVERALASAARTLTRDQLASIAPLLQPIALPASTRTAVRQHRDLLSSLRSDLVELIPTADVQPVRLARFSARTAAMVILLVAALWVLLGTLNFSDIAEAVAEANVTWMVVAFALGLLTYLGSAMGLVAFSPERLGLWRTTLVQIAASVVALVAPAGVGPAALNLRFLNRRRVATPLAVATVGLLQVMQFVTTVALLLVVALVTGSVGTLSLPSTAVLTAVGGVVLAVGVALLIPPVREWLWTRVAPTLQQVWPRLVWVAGNPGRLLMGVGGSLLMAAGYIAAFGASLAAFGYSLPLTSLAITYLGASATGSAVPSPGGVGPVELALTAGLSLAGIPYGVAFSTAILFRLLTFWGRVPLGWAALRYLQRQEDL